MTQPKNYSLETMRGDLLICGEDLPRRPETDFERWACTKIMEQDSQIAILWRALDQRNRCLRAIFESVAKIEKAPSRGAA